MKKLSMVVVCFMIFSLFIPIAHASDDISGHYFEDDMRALIENRLMVGYADGTYKPDRNVTRAEFTTFLVRALDISATSGSSSFTDIKKSKWYYSPIVTATDHNLIGGYATVPSGPIKTSQGRKWLQ